MKSETSKNTLQYGARPVPRIWDHVVLGGALALACLLLALSVWRRTGMRINPKLFGCLGSAVFAACAFATGRHWRLRQRPPAGLLLAITGMLLCVASAFVFFESVLVPAIALSFGQGVEIDRTHPDAETVLTVHGTWTPPSQAEFTHGLRGNWPDNDEWIELHMPSQFVGAYIQAVETRAASAKHTRVEHEKGGVYFPFRSSHMPSWWRPTQLSNAKVMSVTTSFGTGTWYAYSTTQGVVYIYSWRG